MSLILLNETDSKLAENLIGDKSLDFLSFWEVGVYRALTCGGDDLGFVHCNQHVASLVNRCIIARA